MKRKDASNDGMADRPRARSNLLLVAIAFVGLGCKDKPTLNGLPSASSDPAHDWKIYRDPGGLFEAKFFSEPKVDKREESEENGVRLVTISITAQDDARLFVVGKLELSRLGQYDCAVGLAGMMKSSLGKMGCTPENDHVITIAGKPGREATFTCQSQPARGSVRSICDARDIAKGRVDAYSLLALYQNEQWSPSEAKAFLDGFTLL